MHLRLSWLTLAAAAALPACAEMSSDISSAGDTWVILSPRSHWVSQIGADWTPSPEQVLAARNEAKRQIMRDVHHLTPAEESRWRLNAHDILKRWDSYRLQAYGVTQNGKRIIHLFFLTPERPDDGRWRREAIIVGDGGFWFWYADYDPATGKILGWEAQGVA